MADRGIKSVGCCVLCLDTFKDPRILPTCGHTFCLNCMKQYGKDQKTELECPMCRTKARIPAGGLEAFPKNYSLNDMLEISAFGDMEVSSAQGIKPEGYACTQHTENELQLYCIECSKTICLDCVDAEHSSHKVSTISRIAADARIQLQFDVESMKEKLSLTRDKIEETKKKLLCLFAERESDIRKEHEQIKSYLEKQKITLDLELMTLRLDLMKQLEIGKQDVEAQEFSLTSFTIDVIDVINGRDKRANFKVVESLKDLNSRSWELLMKMKRNEPGACRMTNVCFKPTGFLNTSSFANEKQNLIGTIEVKMDSSSDDNCYDRLQLSSFGENDKWISGTLPVVDSFSAYCPTYKWPSTVTRRIGSPVSTARLLDIPSEKASDVDGKKAVGDKKDSDWIGDWRINLTDKKELPCKHKLYFERIDEYVSKGQLNCPSCGKVFGTLRGNQPEGTMTTRKNSWQRLAGYDDCGAIEIEYSFDDGIQGDNHPNPGQPYRGTHQMAYLPANREGHQVLRLLKEAFDFGLVFTIGRSTTTGQDNIVWNDIHHKTSLTGLTGYPDPTYLKSVKKKLAAKGIQ